MFQSSLLVVPGVIQCQSIAFGGHLGHLSHYTIGVLVGYGVLFQGNVHQFSYPERRAVVILGGFDSECSKASSVIYTILETMFFFLKKGSYPEQPSHFSASQNAQNCVHPSTQSLYRNPALLLS